MDKIDYTWDDNSISEKELDLKVEIPKKENKKQEEFPSRHNLQIARRLFHMANGSVVAVLYLLTFSHSQMVHILGLIACGLYVFEQVRINYPELAQKLKPVTKFIMRAEEQLKESAMVPYTIGVLLTIITFPKIIAIMAIFTLALADPLSAIIGIRYGKHRIVPHKSLEGSAAFFGTTFIIALIFIGTFTVATTTQTFFIALLSSFIISAFEMLPIKIDDNLTIPLFSGIMFWFFSALMGIVF